MRGRHIQIVSKVSKQTYNRQKVPLYGEMSKIQCAQYGILTVEEAMRGRLCQWCDEDFRALAERFEHKGGGS
jgi:hypothetical protein